jgi:hypothetical protein
MSWTRRVALVVALLGALVFAGVASASITIAGTGKGIELPQGDGIYTLQGTWTDSASGTNGTYTGTLNNSGDYTTCIVVVGCTAFPELQLCNVVSGTMTFRAPGESFTLAVIAIGPFSLQFASFICLDPNDSSVHSVHFGFVNFGPPPFTEGFPGTIDFALGSLSGTSAAAGASGLFLDRFDFSVTLFF